MNMFYIGVIPPARINDQVLHWKEWVKAEIGPVKAMNSPGHITLIPPFRLQHEKEASLIRALGNFAEGQNAFQVQLENFSHFHKRTLYLKVIPSVQLFKLRENLFYFLQEENFPTPGKEQNFSPHITIASRDLKKADFNKAWMYFKEKKFMDEFTCKDISLLRHHQKTWDVIYTVALTG